MPGVSLGFIPRQKERHFSCARRAGPPRAGSAAPFRASATKATLFVHVVPRLIEGRERRCVARCLAAIAEAARMLSYYGSSLSHYLLQRRGQRDRPVHHDLPRAPHHNLSSLLLVLARRRHYHHR